MKEEVKRMLEAGVVETFEFLIEFTSSLQSWLKEGRNKQVLH